MIGRFALVLSVLSMVPIALAVPLQVDLGYSIYQGVANSTTGLTTFKGWADPTLHQIIQGFKMSNWYLVFAMPHLLWALFGGKLLKGPPSTELPSSVLLILDQRVQIVLWVKEYLDPRPLFLVTKIAWISMCMHWPLPLLLGCLFWCISMGVGMAVETGCKTWLPSLMLMGIPSLPLRYRIV